jgi:hypothetical protein
MRPRECTSWAAPAGHRARGCWAGSAGRTPPRRSSLVHLCADLIVGRHHLCADLIVGRHQLCADLIVGRHHLCADLIVGRHHLCADLIVGRHHLCGELFCSRVLTALFRSHHRRRWLACIRKPVKIVRRRWAALAPLWGYSGSRWLTCFGLCAYRAVRCCCCCCCCCCGCGCY